MIVFLKQPIHCSNALTHKYILCIRTRNGHFPKNRGISTIPAPQISTKPNKSPLPHSHGTCTMYQRHPKNATCTMYQRQHQNATPHRDSAFLGGFLYCRSAIKILKNRDFYWEMSILYWRFPIIGETPDQRAQNRANKAWYKNTGRSTE